MLKPGIFDRLSVRLTAAFLLAATVGVALIALLSYRFAASDFGTFLYHMESMSRMMGGVIPGMMGNLTQAATDFLNGLSRTLWIVGILGLILAIVLGYIFTRHIVGPLAKIAAAAKRVSAGDFDQRVDITGSSELAELAQSFNQMTQTLKHDREVRRNMVADIAHELRTPLSVLQGNVEAMLDGVLVANTENLTSLHQETMLLTRLVDDLRTLSLAEAGQLRLQPGVTDLKRLSQQVIDGFQGQIASKKIRMVLEVPSDLPPAWTDPDRTAQAMRNLLSNALRYTPEGGNITLRLTSDNNGITVSVTDTGVGIPATDLPHVFDRFYRVDRSRSRSTGGSGLGLAIVKQLVEGQGGRVWADSTVGKGSTFSFCLPRLSP